MFTSKLAQYLNIKNESISPLVNVDSLYYEKYEENDIVVRENMIKHMPIAYKVKGVQHADYVITDYIGYDMKKKFEVGDQNYLYVTQNISSGQPNFSSPDRDLIDIRINNRISLNDCVTQYMSKNDFYNGAKNLIDNIDIYISEFKYDVDIYASEQYENLDEYNTQVGELNTNYIQFDQKYPSFVSAVQNYEKTIIYDNADAENLAHNIYTHESLWRLVANNELIPGRIYNMLYYPKYNTVFDEKDYALRKYSNSEINVSVFNQFPRKTGIDDSKQTYNPFPYIIRLTASSKNSFCTKATMHHYKDVFDEYMQLMLQKDGFIGAYYTQGLLSPSIFIGSQIEPILIDCAYCNDGRVTLTLYDHFYGYMFAFANAITDFYNGGGNINVYALNNVDRYSLHNFDNGAKFQSVNDVIQFLTLKKELDSNGHWGNQSYINCLNMSVPDYNTLKQFCTNNLIDISNKLNNRLNTQKAYNIIFNSYTYQSIYNYVKCNKWNVRYDFNNNKIIYLKDEFGNSGDFDFRNAKNQFFGCEFIYNITRNSNNTFQYSTTAYNDALLFQSMQGIQFASNNVIRNSTNVAMLLDYQRNNTNIKRNIIENSSGIMLYDSYENNIVNCTNNYIIGSSENDSYNVNTMAANNANRLSAHNVTSVVNPLIMVNAQLSTINVSIININQFCVSGNDNTIRHASFGSSNSYNMSCNNNTIMSENLSRLAVINLHKDSIDLRNDAINEYLAHMTKYNEKTSIYDVSIFCKYAFSKYSYINYTTTDGKALTLSPNMFDVSIISNVYENGKGTIKLGGIKYLDEIKDDAFAGVSNLLSIDTSVLRIGKNAFMNCDNLTHVSLSNAQIIDTSAFYNCSALNLIDMPSIETIGIRAFESCTSLNNLILPSSLRTIQDYAFKSCNSLTFVDIPSNVTNMYDYIFTECANLQNVSINANILSINKGMFKSSGVHEVELLSISIQHIGQETFKDCSQLVTISNAGNIKTIDSEAFKNCINLANISLSNVIRIFDNAFENCNQINNIIAYNKFTLIYIGNSAFKGCSTLQSINVSPNLDTIGDNAFENCTNLKSMYYQNGTQPNRLYVPSNISNIGSHIFKGCSNIEKATIESIGDYMFENCTDLSTFTIGSNITEISEYAFTGCSSLHDVDVSTSNIVSTANNAFANCINLQNIDLPAAFKYIGVRTFSDVPNLNSITLRNANNVVGGAANIPNYPVKHVIILVPQTILHRYQSDTGYKDFVIRPI